MVNFDYDCSGWATKANTKCYDGLTIAEDAFKGCSGQTVPMVYNHDHSSLDNVIGHALLENRKGGVYAYAKFNDTPTGQTAKKCVENGDLNAFSIWANGLQKSGQVVKHGVIRELSLVLAGCNPGALIQEVVKHSADNMDDEGCEAFIFNDPGSLSLEHGMDPEGNPLEEAVLAHSDDNKEDGKMAEETNGKTLKEVYNSMTDEQKECCHALVGLALEEQDGDGGEDEEDESDMKHNVFDKDAGKQTVLKHSIDDINSIIKGAKTSGTLKAAFDNAGVEQGEIDELSHGIDNIDWLFPEDHLLDTTPRMNDPMTATWFREDENTNKAGPRSGKSTASAVTSEVLYYDMVELGIPFECEKWHLNRLLTLIRVCNEKHKPPKKVSKSEQAARRKALNAKRKKELGTRG